MKSALSTVQLIALVVCLFSSPYAMSQELPQRPLEELINTEEPGWEVILQMMEEATNQVEVLPRNAAQADTALYRTQVTTYSLMGSVVYETGGILVDQGWIRFLGSGSDRLPRSLPAWNKGKSFEDYGQAMAFVLFADDAIGGFFALNGGAFGPRDLGKVFYLSPENLEWAPLGVGYSDFLYFAFTGDLEDFYRGLRWDGWQEEVAGMQGDQGMGFVPFLWTAHESIDSLSRRPVPIQELWELQMDVHQQLMEQAPGR